MFSQIKVRKHIEQNFHSVARKHVEQNFHSVARVMSRGGTLGCWEESKTLAWGFAMAPYQLPALVFGL